MPRRAKPYLHRGWCVTNVGGIRHKLCPEADGPDAAEEAFLGLQTERRRTGGRTFPNLKVVELVALFLDSVKVEKSGATYTDYQRWLTEFVSKHGGRTAREVTRPDAVKFRNELSTTEYRPARVTRGPDRGKRMGEARRYSPKTVNHAVIALKRCWNWAAVNRYLPPGENPFANLPLLHAEGQGLRTWTVWDSLQKLEAGNRHPRPQSIDGFRYSLWLSLV
jgi:hypothetical protein